MWTASITNPFFFLICLEQYIGYASRADQPLRPHDALDVLVHTERALVWAPPACKNKSGGQEHVPNSIDAWPEIVGRVHPLVQRKGNLIQVLNHRPRWSPVYFGTIEPGYASDIFHSATPNDGVYELGSRLFPFAYHHVVHWAPPKQQIPWIHGWMNASYQDFRLFQFRLYSSAY